MLNMHKYKFPKKLKENKLYFFGTKKMNDLMNNLTTNTQKLQCLQLYTIGMNGVTGAWTIMRDEDGLCDTGTKLIITLLVLKLKGVSNFNQKEFERLYGHIVKQYCGLSEKDPFLYTDLDEDDYSIDRLLNEQLLVAAKIIGQTRFTACFNELRSLGHIEDEEGILDTTAFAQFVNLYFFIDKTNADISKWLQ
jgi:hypothetical protein